MRHALINAKTGLVENVIELADQSVLPDGQKWRPPEGTLAMSSDEAGPGWTFANDMFTPPAPPEPSDEEKRAALQWRAQAMLVKSDIAIIRCAEHGVAITEAWRDYRAALRRIIADASMSVALPTPPDYLSGT